MGSSTTHQIISLALGILSGSVMIAILVLAPRIRWRPKGMRQLTTIAGSEPTPGSDAASGLGASLAAVLLSFLFGTITLFIYRAWEPSYLLWFGLTEILWYLLGFSVYAVSKIVREKQLREKQ